MRRRNILLIVGVIFAISISFTAGIYFQNWTATKSELFPIFHQAYQYLLDYAYKNPQVPEEQAQLEYGMINGLFQAFGDPHTRFVPPAAHEIEMDQLEGKYGGIGAQIEKNAEGEFILYPVEASPASLAGLVNGDILLQVNLLVLHAEHSLDDVISEIRGPVNSNVSLKVFRKTNQETLTVTIKREEFQIPSVTYSFPAPELSIGVVKVSIIAASTEEEIDQAMQNLIAQGAEVIIMDLRDNNGGYVDAGVNIAGMFLPSGQILGKRMRGSDDEVLSVTKDGNYLDIPLYIFTNHGTASAAEIITGALQSRHRATVIGTTTYGKDSIQLVFDLEDGSSVHITNAIWYIPGFEYDLSLEGILPDIPLADDKMTMDACLEAVVSDLDR